MYYFSIKVDIEIPDLECFPLFASANYLECVLEPGDLLYIPVSNTL